MFLGTTPGRTRMGRVASRNTPRMCERYSLTSADWLTRFLQISVGRISVQSHIKQEFQKKYQSLLATSRYFKLYIINCSKYNFYYMLAVHQYHHSATKLQKEMG